METWSTHQLFKEAVSSVGEDAATELKLCAETLIGNGVPVVFSLCHLSKITQVEYAVLQQSVNRAREAANYRMFAVRKRSGGRRFIHSVSSRLFRVQQFINSEILQKCKPHPNSFAFHPDGGIKSCAARHCGARWIFQFDLTDFFYDVTESDVFKIFHGLGYRQLLAFELARLCTTTCLPRGKRHFLFSHRQKRNWIPLPKFEIFDPPKRPYSTPAGKIGVLPQGAPTSPMLSNLAARKLDESLSTFAERNGFVYTRYADDITLSASRIPPTMTIGQIISKVVHHIRKSGFRENRAKTRIARPGSRKIVLGLLVDSAQPRLSRETYLRIDRHLHAALKFGLTETATHEGFDSAYGFFNHLSGLVAFVHDVDQERWNSFSERLSRIQLPWALER